MQMLRILLEGQARRLTFRRIQSTRHLLALPFVPSQPLSLSLLGSLQPKSVSGPPGCSGVSVLFLDLNTCFLVPKTSGFTLPSSSAPRGLKTPPLSARVPGEQPPAPLKLHLPGLQLETEGREAHRWRRNSPRNKGDSGNSCLLQSGSGGALLLVPRYYPLHQTPESIQGKRSHRHEIVGEWTCRERGRRGGLERTWSANRHQDRRQVHSESGEVTQGCAGGL